MPFGAGGPLVHGSVGGQKAKMMGKYNRKIALGLSGLALGVGLAACGAHIVAQASTANSLRADLVSSFKGTNTQIVMTASKPGSPNFARGESATIEISHQAGHRLAVDFSWTKNNVSAVDTRIVGKIIYLRVDIPALVGKKTYAHMMGLLATYPKAAAFEHMPFIAAVLHDRWISISATTLERLAAQFSGLAGMVNPGAPTTGVNKDQVKHLGMSLAQELQAMMSVRPEGGGKYALSLPLRPFLQQAIGGILRREIQALHIPASMTKSIDKAWQSVPDTSLYMTAWVADGQLSRIVAAIPRNFKHPQRDITDVSFAISHPMNAVVAPQGAVVVTSHDLMSLLQIALLGAMSDGSVFSGSGSASASSVPPLG